jgi:hypothetical protein
MPKPPDMHAIDVSIRTAVMQAARGTVNKLRAAERAETGLAVTTMASVGRMILANWHPGLHGAEAANVLQLDEAGNRVTQRGHRKYEARPGDEVPDAGKRSPLERAQQLLRHLRKVANPKRGTTLGPIALVRKAAQREGLLHVTVDGKTLDKHLSAAERAVLKPLQFNVPQASFDDIDRKLRAYNITMTRALEVGLEHFAATGTVPAPPRTVPEKG